MVKPIRHGVIDIDLYLIYCSIIKCYILLVRVDIVSQLYRSCKEVLIGFRPLGVYEHNRPYSMNWQ